MNSDNAFNIADCARQRFMITFLDNGGRCDREAGTYLLIDRLAHSLLLEELKLLSL